MGKYCTRWSKKAPRLVVELGRKANGKWDFVVTARTNNDDHNFDELSYEVAISPLQCVQILAQVLRENTEEA